MNNWVKLPIGEIFTIEKGSLQSTKCIHGNYTFITASREWKTHNDYSHDCEALIYAVAASGSLGRCHHYSGKFITSDLCFILRAKDENKRPINYRFYQNVFRFLKEDIVAKTKAGTSKESISQKRFSAYTLPYIDIEHQSYWENKLNNFNKYIESFDEESANQSTYLTKLRQAILQEAIEGKLTADWRKENSVRKGNPDYDAEALLEKIQAEKEKLIKKGKIKEQKPLAHIEADELPFELPNGWVWSRLGEVAEILGGYAYSSTDFKKEGIHQVLRLGNIRPCKIRLQEKPVFVSKQIAENTNEFMLKINDILITMTGTRGKRDYLYTVRITEQPYFNRYLFLNQRVGAIRFYLFTEFFEHLFSTDKPKDDIFATSTGSANQANVGILALKNWLIPLPPNAEQQAISERVEKLLSMVDELEKHVSERKEQSEQLMQAVLREAFEGGK